MNELRELIRFRVAAARSYVASWYCWGVGEHEPGTVIGSWYKGLERLTRHRCALCGTLFDVPGGPDNRRTAPNG